MTLTAKVAPTIQRLTATKDGSKERNERNSTTFQLKLDTKMSKGENMIHLLDQFNLN